MQRDLASRALAAALIDSFSLPRSFWLRAGAVAAETTAKLIPLGMHPLRGIASPCAVDTVPESWRRNPRSPAKRKLNRWVDNPSRAVMLNHMVEQFAHLDAVFHALADPTRRAMLGQLAERELTIGELATPFSMSFAGASKHVRVLENAGLVTRTIRGRTHLCRLQAARLAEADAWLRRYERFWNEKLDRLESLLRAEDEAKAKR
jgi:DNA-binding transcriptional ArsR family regulator